MDLRIMVSKLGAWKKFVNLTVKDENDENKDILLSWNFISDTEAKELVDSGKAELVDREPEVRGGNPALLHLPKLYPEESDTVYKNAEERLVVGWISFPEGQTLYQHENVALVHVGDALVVAVGNTPNGEKLVTASKVLETYMFGDTEVQVARRFFKMGDVVDAIKEIIRLHADGYYNLGTTLSLGETITVFAILCKTNLGDAETIIKGAIRKNELEFIGGEFAKVRRSDFLHWLKSRF